MLPGSQEVCQGNVDRVGVSYYQKTLNSQYRDYTNPDNSEITQQFKLRIVPVTASARWFPTGRTTPA